MFPFPTARQRPIAFMIPKVIAAALRQSLEGISAKRVCKGFSIAPYHGCRIANLKPSQRASDTS